MSKVFDPNNIDRLDNPERRKLLPPEETLINLGLTPGDVFVDVGAGAGYFALPAAVITGSSGYVIATDISQEMLDNLELKAYNEELYVETMLSKPDLIPLPDNTADLTLLALVYHELNDRNAYLAELKRITKPTGTIAIIDWAVVESPMGPPLEHRVPLADAEKEIRQSGLNIISSGMINPYQYFIKASIGSR